MKVSRLAIGDDDGFKAFPPEVPRGLLRSGLHRIRHAIHVLVRPVLFEHQAGRHAPDFKTKNPALRRDLASGPFPQPHLTIRKRLGERGRAENPRPAR